MHRDVDHVRCIYGVSGEGRGHATRSDTVISELHKQKHDVHICGSAFSYTYFKEKYEHVHKIQDVPLVYRKGKLSYVQSIAKMCVTVPFGTVQTCYKLLRLYKTYKPDIIISDYEVFTAMTGWLAGIPVISANNISLAAHTKIEDELHMRPYLFWVRLVDFFATFRARHYVIPTFFVPKKVNRNVTVTAPAIRPLIRKLRPKNGTHIFVYQTSNTNNALLNVLRQTDKQYIVYGYGARPQEKNITFCAFNERAFCDHLASAQAVILGGGFTLISEALFLKKPIFCVPLQHHYEQCLNAYHVERAVFGMTRTLPTVADITTFFSTLSTYKQALDVYTIDPDEFPIMVVRVAQEIIRSSSSDYIARA